MNELTRHIEILLLNSDCVVVPGLGAFVANYIEAQYDAETYTLCPPKRALGFNCQLQNNDSTLVSSYVDAYDISFPEAQRRVENDVEVIRQELVANGKYEFHGVGELRLTSDGRYDFMPCESGLLTPALYAFSSLAIEPLEQYKVQRKPEEKKAPCVHVAKLETTEKPKAKVEYVHHVDRELLRNALLAACMLLLFVFASLPLGRSTKSLQQSSFVGTEALMEFAKEHTPEIAKTQDVAQRRVQKSAPLAAAAKVATATSSVAEDASLSARYTIVLASKVSGAGAAEYVAALKEAGYSDAYVLDRAGSVRKVVYGHYADRSSAMKAIEALRAKDARFVDVWVAEL